MNDRVINFAYGAAGTLVCLALYFAYGWASLRYTEFQVMRAVTVAVACQQPAEAAKLGIACGQPSEPAATAPPASAPEKK